MNGKLVAENNIDRKDLARDLTHEVFLALCEKDDCDTVENIHIWLLSVAKKRIALYFIRHFLALFQLTSLINDTNYICNNYIIQQREHS